MSIRQHVTLLRLYSGVDERTTIAMTATPTVSVRVTDNKQMIVLTGV
jgi:hypothetical protein